MYNFVFPCAFRIFIISQNLINISCPEDKAITILLKLFGSNSKQVTSPGVTTSNTGEFCSTSFIYQNNILLWYGTPIILTFSSKVKFLFNECTINGIELSIDLIQWTHFSFLFFAPAELSLNVRASCSPLFFYSLFISYSIKFI